MKRWQIISAMIGGYIFSLIANVPASHVLGYLQRHGTLPVNISGVDGSIWLGHADKLSWPGKPNLENLDWSLNPFALLMGRLSASINATIQKHPVSGDVSKHFIGGDIYLSDVTTKIPAKTLQQLLDIPFGELDGDVEINLDSAQFKPNLAPIIEARIFWQHAKLTLEQTIDMGQINITVAPNKTNQTTIGLTNSGGDLSLSGDINIATDRGYVLNMNLKPKEATGDVAQSLNLFAQRQADGSYKFKQNGNLRQLGF